MAVGATEILTALQQTTQALNAILKQLQTSLPGMLGTTATSATAGSASALPTPPAGYFNVTNPATGQPVKVPFYNV